MPTIDDQKNSGLSKPLFSSKKTLLDFDSYATRQGVSCGVVQECARLGIVQVRKHKDKTFVVDLPLSAYRHENSGFDLSDDAISVDWPTEEEIILLPADDDTAGEADKCRGDKKTAAEIKALADSTAVIDETIELIEYRQRQQGHKTKLDKIFTSDLPEHAPPALSQADAVTVPDLSVFAHEEKTKKKYVQQKSSFGRLRVPFPRKIVDSVKTLKVWPIAAAAVAFGLCFSVFAYSTSSIQKTHQQQRLVNARVNIQKLMDDNDSARQKARMYQHDLLDSRFEISEARKQLAKQAAELQKLKNSLYKANENVAILKRYNSETLKSLDEEIKSITSQLPAHTDIK